MTNAIGNRYGPYLLEFKELQNSFLLTQFVRSFLLVLFFLMSNGIKAQGNMFEMSDSIRTYSKAVLFQRYHLYIKNNCNWANLNSGSCEIDENVYYKLSKTTKRKLKKKLEEVSIHFFRKRSLIRFLKEHKNAGIKKLVIFGPDSTIDNTVFEVIKLHSALEELEIIGDISELPNNLNELANLKNLIIYHYGSSIIMPLNLTQSVKLERFVFQIEKKYEIPDTDNSGVFAPCCDIIFSDNFSLPISLKTIIISNNRKVINYTSEMKIPNVINTLDNLEEIELSGYFDSCFIDFNKFKKLKTLYFSSHQLVYWQKCKNLNRLKEFNSLCLFLPELEECPDFINYIDSIQYLRLVTKSKSITLNQKYIKVLDLYGKNVLSELSIDTSLNIDVGYFRNTKILNLWEIADAFKGISLDLDSATLIQCIDSIPERQYSLHLLISYEYIENLDKQHLKNLSRISDIGFLSWFYTPNREEYDAIMDKIRN